MKWPSRPERFPPRVVLEHFFARHVSINSFTETSLRSATRGEVMRWVPRWAIDRSCNAARRAAPGALAFDFYQALRRLEALHADKPASGGASSADEPVRLGQEPSLSFAPSSLSAFEPGEGGEPDRLLVRFFGLLGPNGPLPIHLTEHARQRLRQGDATFARFLDVFHHRFLMLFFRAWAQGQPTVSLDRPRDDRFGQHLAALIGLGMPTLRERDAVPDFARLHWGGLLGRHVRNAESLRAILSGYFHVPVQIEQFAGHWMRLSEPSVRGWAGRDVRWDRMP